jgi:hypothetical protein
MEKYRIGIGHALAAQAGHARGKSVKDRLPFPPSAGQGLDQVADLEINEHPSLRERALWPVLHFSAGFLMVHIAVRGLEI